jgi:hypothetical protein
MYSGKQSNQEMALNIISPITSLLGSPVFRSHGTHTATAQDQLREKVASYQCIKKNGSVTFGYGFPKTDCKTFVVSAFLRTTCIVCSLGISVGPRSIPRLLERRLGRPFRPVIHSRANCLTPPLVLAISHICQNLIVGHAPQPTQYISQFSP